MPPSEGPCKHMSSQEETAGPELEELGGCGDLLLPSLSNTDLWEETVAQEWSSDNIVFAILPACGIWELSTHCMENSPGSHLHKRAPWDMIHTNSKLIIHSLIKVGMLEEGVKHTVQRENLIHRRLFCSNCLQLLRR